MVPNVLIDLLQFVPNRGNECRCTPRFLLGTAMAGAYHSIPPMELGANQSRPHVLRLGTIITDEVVTVEG